LGSLAASCECERDGNIPISIKFIKEKLEEIRKQTNFKIS